MSMRLFIWCDCDAFVCVILHMEWVPYLLCAIPICIDLYRSQLHGVNNFTKSIGVSLAPPGPNSFIFMQFSAKNLKNNNTFQSWRTPLGKILDPPLISHVNKRSRIQSLNPLAHHPTHSHSPICHQQGSRPCGRHLVPELRTQRQC